MHRQRPCGREEDDRSGKLKDTAACDSTVTLKSLGCFYVLIILKKKNQRRPLCDWGMVDEGERVWR